MKLTRSIGVKKWKCPECVGSDSDDSDAGPELNGENDAEVNGATDLDDMTASPRASAAKPVGDLLPEEKGSMKPDSHSVFTQHVPEEDRTDGSRVLRKRKTSSVEPDENIIALRKRRRNTGDEASNDETNGHDEASRPHSARSTRRRNSGLAASVIKKTRSSVMVKVRANPTQLRQILSQKPKGIKKRSKRGGAHSSRNDVSRTRGAHLPALAPPFTSASYSQPFYSFYDKETDELKGRPYGGILTEAEADTSKTMPTNDDRRRFDEAKQQAEEEWRQRLLKMQAEVEVPAKKSKKASGPASQIECIEFGGWEIDTWYAAPYPEEYSRNRILYICEFCLKYMNSDYVAWRHKLKCPAKHPPGD